MSDAPATTPAVAAPVVETPAAPTPETTPAVTETPAVVEPTVAATTTKTEPPVEEPAKVEEPVEAAAEEVKPAEPKYDGHLNYNAPTSFLRYVFKLADPDIVPLSFHHTLTLLNREILPLPPKKVFFWFGKEPIESKELTHYLAKGKEAAHSTAAWAAQTGEGLLLFSKTGEKSAPTGVLNLVRASVAWA